jgi:RNA polymerase sigma-70 factor (ECF subfamily)
MTWPPESPFAAVLSHARALDRGAIGALYKRFLPVVYRYVLARVGEPQTAEDLTADTFFAVVEGIGGTRAEDELGFAAWVLGIARNQVAMHFRRGRSRPVAPLPERLETWEERATSGDEGDPLDIITARESWGEVMEALERLTEEQRTVVLYRCVLGYSAEEVGALMGKQTGTVRALQFRALNSLARLLGAESVTANARISGHGSNSSNSSGRDARRRASNGS